jgi:hypothetical protein
MKNEQKIIRGKFQKLKRAPLIAFPEAGKRLKAPNKLGVYIIYNPKRQVVHVGCTPRAKGGIAQRLKNHLAGLSSFTEKHLRGKPKRLRGGYMYRYLVVREPRRRALLEAYTIGCLCPAHIGHGRKDESDNDLD